MKKKFILILLLISCLFTAGLTKRVKLRRRVPPPSDCVLFYKMDCAEPNSFVPDSSGNGNDGNYMTAYTEEKSVAGKINGALYFDGSDYIDTQNPFQSVFQDSFSISIWFKADDGRPPEPGQDILGTETLNQHDIVLLTIEATGKMRFWYGANGDKGYLETSAILSDGQEDWHHIVLVIDNVLVEPPPHSIYETTKYIYFDGELIKEGEFTGLMSAYSNSHPLFIGCLDEQGSPYNYRYEGVIDDVRIYPRALSASEVRDLWEAGI
jgi:hypothetical protein